MRAIGHKRVGLLHSWAMVCKPLGCGCFLERWMFPGSMVSRGFMVLHHGDVLTNNAVGDDWLLLPVLPIVTEPRPPSTAIAMPGWVWDGNGDGWEKCNVMQTNWHLKAS